MENNFKNFLYSEISTQAMYESILNFILSPHIRCGEFECNEFIIRKMDQVNFIIYAEYTYREEKRRDINKAFSIYRNDLIEEINKEALKKGIDISKFRNYRTDFSLEYYYN